MTELVSKRGAILALAYKLEKAGTVPTNQISQRILHDLSKPIRYGVISRAYVYQTLPPKYKNPRKIHHPKKLRKWSLRRKTIAERQHEIIHLVKQIRNVDNLNELCDTVWKMTK